MQIYVAGRTKNTTEVNQIQEVVMELGHGISHDWTGEEGEIKHDWSENPERARQVATLDFLGVAKSDGVILCGYGCDEDSKGGLGCFIECGVAMALGKPILIIGPVRESVFWYAPMISRVAPDETDIKTEAATAMALLEGLVRRARLMLNPSDTVTNI